MHASSPLNPLAFAFSVWLGLAVPAEAALAQAAPMPDALVLRFEASAGALDQQAIVQAVERELGMRVATAGADSAATLSVAVAPTGEVELSYRPERAHLTRAVPLASTHDVPVLIAHLAGNLVRDETSLLIGGLPGQPQIASQPAPPPPTPRSERPSEAKEDAATPTFLIPQWVTSVLVGGTFGPNQGITLSLSQSRRIWRLEIGLGVDLSMGRVDAWVDVDNSDQGEDVRVSQGEVTVPLSVDMRVLGSDEGMLQVGLTGGYRLAGILSGANISGSNGDFAASIRATATFKLKGRHNLMLRTSFCLTPKEHMISSSGVLTLSGNTIDGVVIADAFVMSALVGYQAGWQ